MNKKFPRKKSQAVHPEQSPRLESLHQHKAWKDLTISDVYMFNLVMNHPEICKPFLEMILEKKILHLTESRVKQARNLDYEEAGVRFDAYLENEDNTVYDVEIHMCNTPEGKLGLNARYHQALIDCGALLAGFECVQRKQTILIFICKFCLFNNNRHKYTFQNTCEENLSLTLDDGSLKLFLSTKGTLDDVSLNVMNFLNFIDDHSVKDDWIDSIKYLIAQLKQDNDERLKYMAFKANISRP